MAHSMVQRNIGCEAAAAVAQAAVAAAREQGARINVAVVDRAGLLCAFLRMPDAPLHSIDIAIDKAYTAASFGLATSRWTEVLAEHSSAVRQGLVQRPRFVAFGGGLPIVDNGELAGAVGVSGGSEAQDEEIAKAGLAAIGMNK
ncbi:heme-binding protein [Variovorax paradoxus]|uniref:GlcG/HbpS family heme-binding protein n=1 Tax=Variovorax paradoxus TaxID=34073 RepID=UPI001ABD0535